MNKIELEKLNLSIENNYTQLSSVISDSHEAIEVWFKTNNQNLEINQSADPFIPTVLLCAMKKGLNVWLQTPVSDQILASAQKVQLVKHNWDSSWNMIEFEQQKNLDYSTYSNSKKGVGLFFSGGVDSFYTLKKHREEITHLIFVHGFDIPVNNSKFCEIVSPRLRQIAEKLNLEFIEVQTNIRQYSDRYVYWDDYHGAAIAAVAHFLGSIFHKIYIPSSYYYAFLFPHGSHPGLDPLWSIPSLELIHDGCEASRFDKIKDISTWDLALEHLRVCWQVKETRYNCGQCRKCLWTMAFLRTCHSLSEAKTFPESLDLEAFSQQVIDNLDNRFRILQAIAILEQRGDDPELLEAMQKALKRKNYLIKTNKMLKQWAKKSINNARNILNLPK
ncbi:MAG: hypothetical protein F6K23_31135 [Okeania sp. SIO2C9]|uniref:hypothetical protein n=1 Tax=Okeania sp. SIO2C9 TaxID=2607791 RepID=UPI0013C0ECA8|nr:hypothetical protein [Okeania sp. SIO2C9]NEQ77075.1 hypothetical protein [Okeania sp. SIO2C9]